jgi:hypothetical protein
LGEMREEMIGERKEWGLEEMRSWDWVWSCPIGASYDFHPQGCPRCIHPGNWQDGPFREGPAGSDMRVEPHHFMSWSSGLW